MSNPNDSEYSDSESKPVLALTSRQLVLVFALFLVLAAVLFVVAVKVGRFESKKTAATPGDTTALSPTVEPTTGTTPSPAGQGIQLSPVPSIMPNQKLATGSTTGANKPYKDFPAPAPAVEGPTSTAAPTGNTPALPPSPSKEPIAPNQTASASSAPVVDLEPLEIPTSATETSEAKPVEPPAAASPQVEKTTPAAEPTSASPSAATGPPIQEAATTTPAASSKKTGAATFTVQIAAIPVAKRGEAEDFIRRHKDVAPEIKESPDGKWLRIVVGSFQNREAATAKRDELKKLGPDFSACWVRTSE